MLKLFPQNTPSSCTLLNIAVVCRLIVLLPKGSKHEVSQMIWCGLEQTNSLCGVTQCVNTLQKEDIVQAELVISSSQLHSVLDVFKHLSCFGLWEPVCDKISLMQCGSKAISQLLFYQHRQSTLLDYGYCPPTLKLKYSAAEICTTFSLLQCQGLLATVS